MGSKIHPTAIVAESARIGEGVEIGPYCVIGPHVSIGARTTILSHVVLDGATEIGQRCSIFSGACLGSAPQDKKNKGLKSSLVIGDDNVIREYVTINGGSTPTSKTVVGDRNFIMINCHIAHDCVIGNDIVMANYTGLSGHVVVEDKAVFGGFVGVHQFVHVGRLSMIGGMSKVVMDVPPYSICDGRSAKFCGLNSVGLRRDGYTSKRALLIKKALKILFASGLSLTRAVKEVREELEPSDDIKYLFSFIEKSKRGICRANSVDATVSYGE